MSQQENISIREVLTQKEMRAFIDLPYRLYEGNKYYVPKLRYDEKNTLNKRKNPASEYCDSRYWLAFKGDRVVGRIAAIINRAYIDKWQRRYVRFGWIDFEDDERIAAALLQTVESWARQKGMDAVHGPMGFTDLDFEGMLVDGFDQPGTLATIYNYPYYPTYLEKLGYQKETDWVEFRIEVPPVLPAPLERMTDTVMQRTGVRVMHARKAKDLLPYAHAIFRMINDTYAHLHGVVELTDRQIDYYTKQYFSFIRPDFVTLILDRDGMLAGFGITMPSLSAALQKCNGSLLPLRFLHLLKALRKNTQADLYLVAIRKELQSKGLNAIMMTEIIKSYIKAGIVSAESNPELESNLQIRSFWKHFNAVNHKRRRCFIKYIDRKGS